MKSRTSELAVGVFVILFGIALFFLGDACQWSGRTQYFRQL